MTRWLRHPAREHSGRPGGALVWSVLFVAGVLASTPGEMRAQTPRRIICLVPAVTEMLFAIGAGPQVVGVSSFDTYPPEAATRPKLGALVDPDYERILALRPDLVVVYTTQSTLIDRLRRANIPIFTYENLGVREALAAIRALGERTGRNDAARTLADGIAADLDRVRALVAGRSRPRTALVFGREQGSLRGIYASAGIGFLHDLLTIAGGDDVFGDVQRQSLQVSTEVLLARAPDVILELHETEHWTPAQFANEIGVWSALPSLPAVRNHRVLLLADDKLMVPGPRLAESARAIAAALHPDAVH